MRMWNITPNKMCGKHLRGEHVEIHMMLGALKKGKNIDGFINKGLYEIHNLNIRHNELVDEMARRGWNHKSPINNEDLKLLYHRGSVNANQNIIDLKGRCTECAKLIDGV